MNDQHDYDLFYHALNYRGAQFGATPELAWQELLACHNRIVLKAVEQSEKDAERYRWVRQAGAFDSEIGLGILSETPEKYDAAVDAEMLAEGWK